MAILKLGASRHIQSVSDNRTFRLHPDDNVVVALTDLEAGLPVKGCTEAPFRAVPRGHKMATQSIAPGEEVRKYGQVIGHATAAIRPGEHVHEHNLGMSEHSCDYAFGAGARATRLVEAGSREHFHGYARGDGQIGTRNYVGVIASVNCSATVANHIVREVERRINLEAYPHVDGLVAVTHGTGCAVSPEDEGFKIVQRTVWGYARNPNFGAVLLVGLGCEANQIPRMIELFGQPDNLHFATIQHNGGTRKTIEACVAKLEHEILPRTNEARRREIPVSGLKVALQCGGSDGYSGITANPALGAAVDRLIRRGGNAILAETPEVYGAEHLLTRRARTREVGEALLDRIRWWEDYTARMNATLNNNPSPGNKAGGLTTILEKSLGAVSKAGTTELVSVVRYAEPIREPGLHLMDSPGYDPMSVTGQVASGANLICFTTGRGSVYGNKPVPSIKIASNTPMFARMEEDMDLNAGTIAEGRESLEEVGERIFQRMLAVASGEQTKSESLGFGGCEFVPWDIQPIT